MYGDLQFTNGSFKFKGSGKVFRFKPHPAVCEHEYIVGFTGSANDLISIKWYFENPEKTPAPRVKNCYGLVLTAERKIYRFDDYKKWMLVEQSFSAIGSGADYAMGALSSGASPKDAVEVAMQHDIYTGMGVLGERI